jgi:zinc/manganese transport system substrate-binding protein
MKITAFKRHIRSTFAAFATLSLLVTLPAHAALNVFATVPEWGALVQELGGDKVKVYTATHGLQDPHRIQAKPSLIAQARNAQLVVATGAELEIGWLPLVVRDSGNSRIQPGQPGYFEAASAVHLLEIPTRLDRADGDVHASGNPHIQTDPRNILKVAEALNTRLSELDPANSSAYRANFQAFSDKWRANLSRWEKQAAPLRGLPVIVQHKAFPYLESWLGLKQIASLEPKPGVEASSGYLAEVLARQQATPAKLILRPAYQPDTPSRWLAERAKLPVVTVPFTVGGTPEAKDLSSLFDDTVSRLLAGLSSNGGK